MAQVDFFLKLDPIKGESTDAKFTGQIELQSFSFSCAQSGTQQSGSGGGAGKVKFQDLHCTKPMDLASNKLMLACASGQHFPTVTLTCRKAGGDQNPFCVYTLTDVLVSSYQCGGHGHSEILPTDQFSMNFGSIKFEYGVQNADGSVGAMQPTGWNVKANTKIGS